RTSWTKTFSSLGTFQIRQVVYDSKGQMDQATRQVTVLNRKPVGNVTTPSSSNEHAPTKFDMFRPTFRFTYSDADGDAQQQYNVRINRYDGTLVLDSGIKNGNALAWQPTADLPENVNLYIRVRVHDGYEWGGWSSMKYFYIETNRPPVAAFDWTPKPVWEGDTLQLLDRASDPDGDALTYAWTIRAPGGAVTKATAQEPQIAPSVPGTYTVTQTVSDGRETSRVTHAIAVRPLTLTGQVHHTPQWLEIHEAAGHETVTAPKDFYTGEILVLYARTSEAPVAWVRAGLAGARRGGGTLETEVRLQAGGEPQTYEAELYDERWQALDTGLAEGEQTVVFTVRYANGVEKTDAVPIRIIGHVLESVQVHRRQ
ncbi:PKD domain-containing protein, partial [Paenibacillus sp. IB182496]